MCVDKICVSRQHFIGSKCVKKQICVRGLSYYCHEGVFSLRLGTHLCPESSNVGAKSHTPLSYLAVSKSRKKLVTVLNNSKPGDMNTYREMGLEFHAFLTSAHDGSPTGVSTQIQRHHAPNLVNYTPASCVHFVK